MNKNQSDSSLNPGIQSHDTTCGSPRKYGNIPAMKSYLH